MPRTGSLRRRLLALLLGVTALTWIITSVIGYVNARHEAHEILDGHLAQTAALLIAQPAGELEEIDTEHTPALHRYSLKVAFQVWGHGTRLGLHSANAPDAPLSSVREGFSDATHAGRAWRVFSAWDAKGETLVQVAERQDARDEISGALARGLAASLLLALPFLAAAVWVAVGQGLRPLRSLQAELARRGPDHLDALPTSEVPAEVLPLVTGLNRLFVRMGELIARERRFTADAAHELRTPLAILRVQAQVARTASIDSARMEALDGLIAGAERATRLVEQLLTLARLESGPGAASATACDLREIVRAEAAAIAPQAIARNIDIEFAEDPAPPVHGHPELLAILARNLMDNAVRYALPVGTISLRVYSDERSTVRLEVTNSGPTLEPGDLRRLGERFHRIPGNDAPGSGIGLSIVVRIAELHGGSVQFFPGPDGTGLRVQVTLDGSTTAPSPTDVPKTKLQPDMRK
jgi:two-component system sensor histidine kinase QseC